MTNAGVEHILDTCASELASVSSLHSSLGATALSSPYLTRYALMRACGTIELAYKGLVADRCSRRANRQVKHYLNRTVRESSRNPSFDNICKLIKTFDTAWHTEFKARLDARADKAAILDGLQSLVDARNDFAHGGMPNMTLGDVLDYYARVRKLIDDLDATLAT